MKTEYNIWQKKGLGYKMPNRLQRSARTTQREKYKVVTLYLMKNLPKTNKKYTAKDLSKLFNIKLMTIYQWIYKYGWRQYLRRDK
tara:strand:- start:1107 stop:1361 length:255 start_codon:yes stop_codon:yes gene_type:complete